MNLIVALLALTISYAAELKEGSPAPLFEAKTQTGADFSLSSRKGHWTVLYFYPKASTPGCTKQACAYRDSLKNIRALDADVVGVSADSVESQKSFHDAQHLNFTLIADASGRIIDLYGTKMAVLSMSKRWTFLIDPNLVIRKIEKDVDPAVDSEQVADALKKLQNK